MNLEHGKLRLAVVETKEFNVRSYTFDVHSTTRDNDGRNYVSIRGRNYDGGVLDMQTLLLLPPEALQSFIAALQWCAAGHLGRIAIAQEHPELEIE